VTGPMAIPARVTEKRTLCKAGMRPGWHTRPRAMPARPCSTADRPMRRPSDWLSWNFGLKRRTRTRSFVGGLITHLSWRRSVQESVFLVAGASGGIGRSIASALLSVSAEVMLLGRSMAKLRAALPSCDPGKGLFLVADLTDAAAIERVSSAVSQRGRLDAVILSSGIYERYDDPEVFRRQINANVLVDRV
jgi:short chain dehydrogenase